MIGVGLFSTPTTFAKAESTKKSTKTESQKVVKKDKVVDKKVIVTIKAGDTLESIAAANKSDYVRVFNANESITNPDIVNVGDKVRIPTKNEKLPNRFEQIQAQQANAALQPQVVPVTTDQTTASYTTQNYTSAPVDSSSYYVGNGMWCTDYVHSKRPDVAVFGNAGYNWMNSAEAAGKSTGKQAKKGAVAVTNGHVAYVEKVNKDGSYVVSEMGWNYQAGNYNKRTVKAGEFGGFIY